MATRTITLTNRPPVKIDEDNWPVIASASDDTHDGQVRAQANRTHEWWIKVRQHEDGRAIVYAGYRYDTNFQDARGHEHKHGDYLAHTDAKHEEICRAVTNVAARMESGEHNGDDAAQWDRLAQECIADLPAEEI